MRNYNIFLGIIISLVAIFSISARANPFFSASPTCGSPPLKVKFTDESIGKPTKWIWDFGDGTLETTTLSMIYHKYEKAGIYDVKLTVEYREDEIKTRTKTDYIVVETLVADFSVASSSGDIKEEYVTGSTPLMVHFQDSSAGCPNQWIWSFGDGHTSKERNPSHTYEREGNYDVSLTVQDAANRREKKIKYDYIVIIPPQDIFPPEITEFSPPQGATFIPPDLPTEITITITDKGYGLDDETKKITEDSFEITRSIPREDVREELDTTDVKITDKGSIPYVDIPEFKIYTYTLTFTSDEPFKYGSYQFCLKPIDAAGNQVDRCYSFTIYQPRGVPNFEAEQTSNPLVVQFTNTSTGNPSKWEWDFGDGSELSVEQHPMHTYSDYGIYTIRLTVTYADDRQDSIEKSIALMRADFTATPIEKYAPLEVYFDDKSEGPITSRTWGFGDKEIWNFEETNVLQRFPHVYHYAGTYTVTLTVRNSDTGWEHTKSQQIVVPPPLCKAAFEYDISDLKVQFTDTSAGNPSEWVWDFGGDGSSELSDEGDATHIYSDYGTYTVSLTVTCADGTDTFSQKIVVPPPTPCQNLNAAFDYNRISDLEVQFTDTSKGDIIERLWDFGHDGAISIEPFPLHEFPSHGTYTVRLTVICADEIDTEKKIVVLPPLPEECKATFEYDISGLEVQFTDMSKGDITERLWDFGHDGETSIEPSPLHTFPGDGTYAVSLTVTCADGKKDTVEKRIEILPLGVGITGRVLSAADNQPLKHRLIDENISALVQLRQAGEVRQETETSVDDGSYTLNQAAKGQQYQVRVRPLPDFYFPALLDDITAPAQDVIIHLQPLPSFPAPTTTFSDVSGEATLDGTLVERGDVILAIDATGVPVGAEEPMGVPVRYDMIGKSAGIYLIHAYGDNAGTEVDEGFRKGDKITFVLNNQYFYTPPDLEWMPKEIFNDVSLSFNSEQSLRADFTFPDEGTLTVQFTDTSTGKPEPPKYWLWDFGDGNSSTEPSPSHTYAEADDYKVYTVTLTVANDSGGWSWKNASITVPPSVHTDIVENHQDHSEDAISLGIPDMSALFTNYPNPFNPETWLPYQLADDADVQIQIYDVSGRLITTIHLGRKTTGFYTTKDKAAYWNGRDAQGEQVASGIYFYHIRAGVFNATRKMIILR